MWFAVFQVLSVLFIITFLIMFIGFWTYSDYYTNISKTKRSIFFTATGIILGVTAEIGLINLGFSGVHTAYVSGVYVMGIGTSIVLVLGIIFSLVVGFEKSREYFGKKRNKI